MGKLRLSLFVVGLAACGSNNNTDGRRTRSSFRTPRPMRRCSWMRRRRSTTSRVSTTAHPRPRAGRSRSAARSTTCRTTATSSRPRSPPRRSASAWSALRTAWAATNLLGTATSDGTGAFTSTAIPATNPVDAFVRATSDHCSVTTTQTCVTSTTCPATETCVHERPIDEYPPAPLVANLTGLPLITFTNTNLALLELAAQVTQSRLRRASSASRSSTARPRRSRCRVRRSRSSKAATTSPAPRCSTAAPSAWAAADHLQRAAGHRHHRGRRDVHGDDVPHRTASRSRPRPRSRPRSNPVTDTRVW